MVRLDAGAKKQFCRTDDGRKTAEHTGEPDHDGDRICIDCGLHNSSFPDGSGLTYVCNAKRTIWKVNDEIMQAAGVEIAALPIPR